MTLGEKNDSARRPSLRWAVALCCWVAFIWGHSLIQGPQSSLESGMVVALVRPVFEALGVTDVNIMTLIVRKGAHFSEYAVLGVLARCLYGALRSERASFMTNYPVTFVIIVGMVPVVDECLQLFVPGRSGQPTDVLIDLAGLATGALLAWLAGRLRGRRGH